MKSRKNITQDLQPEEIAQAYVFPGSEEGNDARLEVFQQYRKQVESARSDKDRIVSQLLQLKFQIEDAIKAASFNKAHHFGFFLKEYISRLEKKNKEFASEVDIDPTELSLFINRHRDPTEKFIIRLEIHSNKNFPAVMWFKLIEKEKEYKLTHNKEIRTNESKHVKKKLQFSL